MAAHDGGAKRAPRKNERQVLPLPTYLQQFALTASCEQAKHVYSVTLVHDDIDLVQTAQLQHTIDIVKQLAVCLNELARVKLARVKLSTLSRSPPSRYRT